MKEEMQILNDNKLKEKCAVLKRRAPEKEIQAQSKRCTSCFRACMKDKKYKINGTLKCKMSLTNQALVDGACFRKAIRKNVTPKEYLKFSNDLSPHCYCTYTLAAGY